MRQPSEVVGPRQDVEVEVRILFEVGDQVATSVDVCALQLHRGAVTDRGVEIGERGVERVVRSGATQDRVAGEPHAAAAGVCGGAAELVAGLHDHDRQPFAGGRVRADQATTGSSDDDVSLVIPRRHAFTLTGGAPRRHQYR